MSSRKKEKNQNITLLAYHRETTHDKCNADLLVSLNANFVYSAIYLTLVSLSHDLVTRNQQAKAQKKRHHFGQILTEPQTASS